MFSPSLTFRPSPLLSSMARFSRVKLPALTSSPSAPALLALEAEDGLVHAGAAHGHAVHAQVEAAVEGETCRPGSRSRRPAWRRAGARSAPSGSRRSAARGRVAPPCWQPASTLQPAMPSDTIRFIQSGPSCAPPLQPCRHESVMPSRRRWRAKAVYDSRGANGQGMSRHTQGGKPRQTYVAVARADIDDPRLSVANIKSTIVAGLVTMARGSTAWPASPGSRACAWDRRSSPATTPAHLSYRQACQIIRRAAAQPARSAARAWCWARGRTSAVSACSAWPC